MNLKDYDRVPDRTPDRYTVRRDERISKFNTLGKVLYDLEDSRHLNDEHEKAYWSAYYQYHAIKSQLRLEAWEKSREYIKTIKKNGMVSVITNDGRRISISILDINGEKMKQREINLDSKMRELASDCIGILRII